MSLENLSAAIETLDDSQPRDAATRDLFPEVLPNAGNDDENQRYTIRRALGWVMQKVGILGFTLDVAACRAAHVAKHWYGPEQPHPELRDGLQRIWFGDTFNNPPWSDIEPWVVKAWAEWRNGTCTSIAMLLPGSRRHSKWWQEHVEPYRDRPGSPLRTFEPPERFPYGNPSNPLGVGCPEPNFTSVLLVWKDW
ncbi:MAG: DNA N-6-adenine-methyltransferase [Myxococcaceae bacterium]